MIWYLSIKILIDIDIISSFRLPGGFLARSPVVPKLRRSWHPSTWSSRVSPSQTDFGLNASGMPCAFSGWTPRKKRTDMAAIFGADWADLWSFHHESSHLPVQCACLPFFLFFYVSIWNQVRKHLANLYIDERTFHHFIKDWGFGTGPIFGEVSRCSRRVFCKARDFAAVSAIFGCSSDFCSTSQDELIKHFEKVQAGQMSTARVQIYCICEGGIPYSAVLVLSAWDLQNCHRFRRLLVLFCDFCDVQVVVDYLKLYDKDGKGALSREELQEAIRGAVGDVGWLDELQTCGVPLGWTELIDFQKELGRNSDRCRPRALRGTPGGNSCTKAGTVSVICPPEIL